jgi:hypothetical protein
MLETARKYVGSIRFNQQRVKANQKWCSELGQEKDMLNLAQVVVV